MYVSNCTVSVSLRWVIHLSQWFIMVCLWLYCISITKMSDTMYVYHSDCSWYMYVSNCTVSVSLRWVIHLSQWFIMVCLWLYCISITKMSDTSITVIYHGMSDCTVSVSLRWVIRLSQWFIMVCLWLYCISITKKSDTSITVIYHDMSLTVLYQYHQDEWCLSQWFIMVCLWLYCISITKKSDTSITVIYHDMSLTVLYQYHQDEWYVYHSDLSWYVSDCTVQQIAC